MSTNDNDALMKALGPRVKGPCPNCGSNAWSIGGVTLPPTVPVGGGPVNIGQGIPMVSVVCTSCALLHFFAAVPLGLFPAASATSDKDVTP